MSSKPPKETKQITKNGLRGWDVLRVLQDKKGNVTEKKSFVKKNPISQPNVKQQGLKHL